MIQIHTAPDRLGFMVQALSLCEIWLMMTWVNKVTLMSAMTNSIISWPGILLEMRIVRPHLRPMYDIRNFGGESSIKCKIDQTAQTFLKHLTSRMDLLRSKGIH